jgi:hypothetical protein
MIRGSCLCGGVTFEMDRAVGPFELCHCNRCRKASGSAFVAGLGVRRDEFRFLSGRELVRTYEAPILRSPPAYRVCFCTRCGTSVPDPNPESEWFEIAAGLLDDDPQVRPDKHIYVDFKAPWFEIAGDLPQFDMRAILKHREDTAQQAGAADRAQPRTG